MSHLGFDGVDPAGLPRETIMSHYGIARKSGRYPWGSGGAFGTGDTETEIGRSSTILSLTKSMRNQGISEMDIAASFGMTQKQLRETKTIALAADRQYKINQITRMREEKGMSNVAIGKQLGIPEPTVRSLMAKGVKEKAESLNTQIDYLRSEADKQGIIDVGIGNEHHLDISAQKLGSALAVLKEEGYAVLTVQTTGGNTPGKKTGVKVLIKPTDEMKAAATPTEKQKIAYQVAKDALANNKIGTITKYSNDGGDTLLGIEPPISFSSKRLGIKYKEDGGADADGVMYVRPGVKDIELGGKNYAQVRVMVDGSHYIKGMAMYKTDLPDGVDIQFNTNKSNSGNKLDALKELKKTNDGAVDMENPFGSQIARQIGEMGPKGRVNKLTSVMNLVNEAGDWKDWNSELSSQVLSKQSPILAKKQLDLAVDRKRQQLDEIMAYTNPTVRKKLLQEFSDAADRSAITMQGAGMKNQITHVILPLNTLKDNEIYAPNYPNGERIVLVRFPHGGKFEIPEVTNNTTNREGKRLLGQATDAVGINSRVAERLSGADFDGDTVLVIPQRGRGGLKTSPALRELKNFNVKDEYPAYDGMQTIDKGVYNAKTKKVEYPPGKRSDPSRKGNEMGNASNLINDMTIGGATNSELARAVKYSMVVIDSEKHALDFKAAYDRNGIDALKRRYQGVSEKTNQPKGAATIISRAKSRDTQRRVKERGVDPLTGKKKYVDDGDDYVDKKGNVVSPTMRTTKLQKALDSAPDGAYAITSGGSKKTPGTVIEAVYAEHSNTMRSIADEARRQMVNTVEPKKDPSATKAYARQVKSLDDQLTIALRNKPLERQAKIIADHTVKLRTDANPEMDKSEKKKLNAMALNEARLRTGAKRKTIEITQSEWDAIQAGAISPTRLRDILDNTDPELVKKYATPKQAKLMDGGKAVRAAAMLANGSTQAEVAAALGVSLTTLKTTLNGES